MEDAEILSDTKIAIRALLFGVFMAVTQAFIKSLGEETGFLEYLISWWSLLNVVVFFLIWAGVMLLNNRKNRRRKKAEVNE